MLRYIQCSLYLVTTALVGLISSNAKALEVSYSPTVKWHTNYYYWIERENGQEACNYQITQDYKNNFDGRITTTFVLDPPATSNSNWPVGHCHFVYNNGQAPVDTRDLSANLSCPRGGILSENKDRTAYLCKLADPIIVYNRKAANLGPTCSANGGHSCGEPINTANGNMWHSVIDYKDRIGGTLSFLRTYNSLNLMAYGIYSMGSRWTHDYDASIQAVSPSSTYDDQQCYKRIDNGLIFCESTSQKIAAGTAPSALQVQRGNGKRFVFTLKSAKYVGDSDTNDYLEIVYGDNNITGFQYHDATTLGVERYDSSGRLLSIKSKGGAMRRLTYSDGTTNNSAIGRYPADSPVCSRASTNSIQSFGRLLCVTDDWGRQLNFEYDDKGRMTLMTDPSGHAYVYEYDGVTGGCTTETISTQACLANNLTKVTYPDSTSHQYIYNEVAYIGGGNACSVAPAVGNGFANLYNSMTGLVDENGTRYITWNYSCSGLATGSQLAGNVNKVSIAFTINGSDASTVLRSELSTIAGDPSSPKMQTSLLTPKTILGVGKISYLDNPCAVCGSVKSRNFDANGNVASTYDWAYQFPTLYTYDLQRNLERSRTEASNSEIARVITTIWHPTMRLPVTVAEPKLITKKNYDDNGNVLLITKQATTDETGSMGVDATVTGMLRTWLYTYNPYGQVISATGPRKDLADTISYTYDAQGNLASITNALGQTTTYSKYDDNGNVGRIVQPNGMATEFAYTLRGAIAGATVFYGVAQEATYYEYDPAGQLIKKTMPDGSWHRFEYDPAHRLVSVGDNLSNSTKYQLDLTGNRIGEQVFDRSGVLKRQITREFNTLNQLIKVTGATQ